MCALSAQQLAEAYRSLREWSSGNTQYFPEIYRQKNAVMTATATLMPSVACLASKYLELFILKITDPRVTANAARYRLPSFRFDAIREPTVLLKTLLRMAETAPTPTSALVVLNSMSTILLQRQPSADSASLLESLWTPAAEGLLALANGRVGNLAEYDSAEQWNFLFHLRKHAHALVAVFERIMDSSTESVHRAKFANTSATLRQAINRIEAEDCFAEDVAPVVDTHAAAALSEALISAAIAGLPAPKLTLSNDVYARTLGLICDAAMAEAVTGPAHAALVARITPDAAECHEVRAMLWAEFSAAVHRAGQGVVSADYFTETLATNGLEVLVDMAAVAGFNDPEGAIDTVLGLADPKYPKDRGLTSHLQRYASYLCRAILTLHGSIKSQSITRCLAELLATVPFVPRAALYALLGICMSPKDSISGFNVVKLVIAQAKTTPLVRQLVKILFAIAQLSGDERSDARRAVATRVLVDLARTGVPGVVAAITEQTDILVGGTFDMVAANMDDKQPDPNDFARRVLLPAIRPKMQLVQALTAGDGGYAIRAAAGRLNELHERFYVSSTKIIELKKELNAGRQPNETDAGFSTRTRELHTKLATLDSRKKSVSPFFALFNVSTSSGLLLFTHSGSARTPADCRAKEQLPWKHLSAVDGVELVDQGTLSVPHAYVAELTRQITLPESNRFLLVHMRRVVPPLIGSMHQLFEVLKHGDPVDREAAVAIENAKNRYGLLLRDAMLSEGRSSRSSDEQRVAMDRGIESEWRSRGFEANKRKAAPSSSSKRSK
ncbi:hypothetical protein J8273_7851 [Carpediemonas membranifera]|uniref:Uncharacterized protein n=1 Tax=Carpediemonas membranifera TaxID=201153 RepID=A0A8J6ARN6_9EUKA|nr:hypothetical protein J8273_7851 [Carpediemonas membranifera]|eukprot:KAG9390500.1 hypothetical protein J8273_7851 [Carpediemonas membranifera]